jgi:hypothetical protein
MLVLSPFSDAQHTDTTVGIVSSIVETQFDVVAAASQNSVVEGLLGKGELN